MLDSLRKELSEEAGSRVVVLPPIDCSTLPDPERIPPGLAVLVLLRDWLADNGFSKSAEFNEVLRGYVKRGEGYTELTREISWNADDYVSASVSLVSARLKMRDQLKSALGSMTRGDQRILFVVTLDDFDLVGGRIVRAWQSAFLDELCQCQLLFVLAADLNRLDYLSWNNEEQIDDKTGRALLDKMLPQAHRVELEEWTAENELKEETGKNFKDLHDFFPQMAACLGVTEEFLGRLLPKRPRGLVNLQEVLRSRALSDQDAERPEEILALLASCRGEPLWARRIKEVRAKEWIGELPWKQGGYKPEDCLELVEAASSTELDSLNLAVSSEKKASRETSYRIVIEENKLRLDPMDHSNSSSSLYQRDPSWHDPLRHEHLRHAPLRDSDWRDRGLWMETLTNIALEESEISRNRLVREWGYLQSLAEEAVLRIRPALVDDQVLFDLGKNLGSLAPWVREVENGVEIGWWPLAEATIGVRETWPHGLAAAAQQEIELAQLNTVSGKEGGKTSIIPSRLRSIIVLLNSLSKVPWQTLSEGGLILPTRYAALTWCFVSLSYVHALTKMGATVKRTGKIQHLIRSFDTSSWETLRSHIGDTVKRRIDLVNLIQKTLPKLQFENITPGATQALLSAYEAFCSLQRPYSKLDEA